MHRQTNTDKQFLATINAKLHPILRIIQSADRNFPHFEICLCETVYAMQNQVTIEWGTFPDLVNTVGVPLYGVEAGFNNTGRVFWFMAG